MAKLTIRTPYDGLPPEDSGVRCTKEESKTLQSHKEYCDIDKQIALAGAGVLLSGRSKAPIYGDFSETPKDIHSQFQMVKQFEQDFQQHSPEVRARFRNNPSEMAAFLSDPANMEESYKLGLRVKPVVEQAPVDQKAVLKATIREVLNESNGGSAK